MAEHYCGATWRTDVVLTGEIPMRPCPREEGLRRELQLRMEEVDRQRNQRVVPQSTRTGSMASLIQQEMSTAAGEGAGSSSAHAALPRSNTGLDTQRILDQLDPLTREAHIGLVKHGDRMYSYMSHCCSPFIGLDTQTPTTPTDDVKLAGRDTLSVIPSKILESSRRSQDTTEMLVCTEERVGQGYVEYLDQCSILTVRRELNLILLLLQQLY